MTTREFLTKVIALDNAELSPKARELVQALDKKNELRKQKPSKKSLENEPIKAQIISLLREKPMTASEIAESLGITTQKASGLCVVMAKENTLQKKEIKVAKKGKQMQYSV